MGDREQRCPRCSAALLTDGPEGPCPRCLMKLGLEEAGERRGSIADDATDTRERSSRGETPVEMGPYRMIEKIGEGGMGEVWRAEQRQPVRRTVAIKIIKRGMDTEQVVARFQAERQALAVMDHASVAKVFDAGSTPRGRPYFVMEYVKGVPITTFCDQRRLTMQERLALFIQVCEGVQHAHQKGIIHRDLKPSNVLVAIEGDRPMPKIIDFGVAKATVMRLTEQTLFTQMGALIGTPEYMSPEQASMRNLDIDTRTDVYSLGVLLYELLTGVLPFDRARLRQAGYEEICRRIREQEPSKPSTRLSTMADDPTASAVHRRLSPKTLIRELKGDLDWITMRALEKDRARRYGSPSHLAADVERHLRHEPVLAGPPSVSYRAGKFVRRHRVGVTAAGVVGLVLVLGVMGTTYGMLRALRAESQARYEATTADRVVEFLVGLFEVSDPGRARGETITAREILDKGARAIDVELQDEPAIRARLLDTMGRVYGSLGLYEEAIARLGQAAATRERQSHGKATGLALSLHHLGTIQRIAGRYDESEETLSRAIAIREEVLGPDHPEVAASLVQLASLHADTSRHEEAERLYLRAIASLEQSGDERLGLALSNLGNTYQEQGRFDEAEAAFRRALAFYERQDGPSDLSIARVLNNLSGVCRKTGRLDDAERMAKRALSLYDRMLEPDHAERSFTLTNLAAVYVGEGRSDEAEELYKEALAIQEEALGPDHLRVAWTLNDLGVLYSGTGDKESAEAVQRRALAIKEKHLGRDSPDVAMTLGNLAAICQETRRTEESLKLYQRALAIQRESLGPRHPSTAMTLHNLGNLHASVGRLDEAGPLYDQAMEIWRETLGPDHPNIALCLLNQARLAMALGRHEEAEALFERAADVGERALGTIHPLLAAVFYNKARLLAATGRQGAALRALEEAVRRGHADPGLDQDPSLAPLRDLPGFRAIVARLGTAVQEGPP